MTEIRNALSYLGTLYATFLESKLSFLNSFKILRCVSQKDARGFKALNADGGRIYARKIIFEENILHCDREGKTPASLFSVASYYFQWN